MGGEAKVDGMVEKEGWTGREIEETGRQGGWGWKDEDQRDVVPQPRKKQTKTGSTD